MGQLLVEKNLCRDEMEAHTGRSRKLFCDLNHTQASELDQIRAFDQPTSPFILTAKLVQAVPEGQSAA